jgi:hypothetical protein
VSANNNPPTRGEVVRRVGHPTVENLAQYGQARLKEREDLTPEQKFWAGIGIDLAELLGHFTVDVAADRADED